MGEQPPKFEGPDSDDPLNDPEIREFADWLRNAGFPSLPPEVKREIIDDVLEHIKRINPKAIEVPPPEWFAEQGEENNL